MSIIRDESLWESGETKINWVKANMPLLRGIEEEFSVTKPFAGLKVALSVHLEAKTAYLCKVLASGGAEMFITGSNPLSTQDDVAAALAADGFSTVDDIRYIERGYEDFHIKLQNLGALIERVNDDKDIRKFKLRVG